MTSCPEGFVCASKVQLYGKGHDGAFASGRSRNDAAPDNLYEWGCPAGNPAVWHLDGYSKAADQCEDPDACVCVMRTADTFHTKLQEGEEQRAMKFEVYAEGNVEP